WQLPPFSARPVYSQANLPILPGSDGLGFIGVCAVLSQLAPFRRSTIPGCRNAGAVPDGFQSVVHRFFSQGVESDRALEDLLRSAVAFYGGVFFRAWHPTFSRGKGLVGANTDCVCACIAVGSLAADRDEVLCRSTQQDLYALARDPGK